MNLGITITVEFKLIAPVNFDATFYKPAHFPSRDNIWEPDIRWQTFHFLGQELGVVFKNTGSVDQPGIQAVIIGIVLQNCTVRRSIQMMQALFEKYGVLLEFAGKQLWCF